MLMVVFGGKTTIYFVLSSPEVPRRVKRQSHSSGNPFDA